MLLQIGQKVGDKWLVSIEGSKTRPRLRIITFEPTKKQIKEWMNASFELSIGDPGFVFVPGLLLTHKESCNLLNI